jgi:hypothetical protein
MCHSSHYKMVYNLKEVMRTKYEDIWCRDVILRVSESFLGMRFEEKGRFY